MRNPAHLLLAGALLWPAACATTPPPPQDTAPESQAAQKPQPAGVEGWLSWRGPHQAGRSDETGLFQSVTLDGENHLWSYEISGRGAPVIAGDRLYAMGYRGEGPDLQELLFCLDVNTGKLLWEHGFNDFLSDIIYNRYAIGSPSVDPATGMIYAMTSAGLLVAFSPEGELKWQISMMEALGRLTFPNGRTGAPVILEDRIIVHAITTSWGPLGPARDRFYAFDKQSGQLLWYSTPGVPPKDSSYSTPVIGYEHGRRVLYAGTGCGNVVAVNVDDGTPLWRHQLSLGGVNAAALIDGDRLIAVSGKENPDDSGAGRMVALKLGGDWSEMRVRDKSAEAWRLDGITSFTSSPVLAGGRVYQTVATGELVAIDAKSGQELWREKLANAQLHASPLHADGKLYVPMQDGSFHILKPGDKGAETLAKVQLEGNALGAPAIWRGRIFVHTTAKLYAFGPKTAGPAPAPVTTQDPRGEAAAGALRIIPADTTLWAETSGSFRLEQLDAIGRGGKPAPAGAKLSFKGGLRENEVDVKMSEVGFQLHSKRGSRLRAGMLTAAAGETKSAAPARLRTFPKLPWKHDFEAAEAGGHPPGAWIGAKLKWKVTALEGDKGKGQALVKTLDRVLFQRSTTFVGPAGMKGIEVLADVMSDGNRRGMSVVGVVNQRYIVALDGNWQQIQVFSNHERLKVTAPFSWKPGRWYRLRSRVDVAADGSGLIRAKAWPVGEPEPEAWSIEAKHAVAHTEGAPGIYGFSPQSQHPVYVDNIEVREAK